MRGCVKGGKDPGLDETLNSQVSRATASFAATSGSALFFFSRPFLINMMSFGWFPCGSRVAGGLCSVEAKKGVECRSAKGGRREGSVGEVLR